MRIHAPSIVLGALLSIALVALATASAVDSPFGSGVEPPAPPAALPQAAHEHAEHAHAMEAHGTGHHALEGCPHPHG